LDELIADTITQLPEGFDLLATTASIPVAAFSKNDNGTKPIIRFAVSS
jgi:GMP synthase-like glutamine amidotransferase